MLARQRALTQTALNETIAAGLVTVEHHAGMEALGRAWRDQVAGDVRPQGEENR